MRAYYFLTSFLMIGLLSISWSVQQADATNFYVGAGGSYAIENFDGGDFDNSAGVNLKFGYKLHPLFDLEFDFNYIDEFEDDLRGVVLPAKLTGAKIGLNIATYMFVMKGYFPIDSETVKLSVVLGGGLMDADSTIKADLGDSSITGSSDDTDLAWKIGLGLDVFASPEVSFGFEGNYTMGIDDLEDIRYLNFTLGAAYHF